VLELVLRLGFSLAAVLGLFWLVAHLGSRRLGGSRALLHVRARQSLSRTASVAVVEVGDRVLVVGVADGGVRLLTELDPASLPETPVRPQPSEAEPDAETVLAGALAGRPTRLNDRLAATVAARLTRSTGSAPSHRAERSAPTVTGVGRPASGAGLGTRDQSRDRVGGLQGSVLSTQTWKQAWDAATARHGGPENVAATAGPLDG
jgi:flagellar protein FliO/FliZ